MIALTIDADSIAPPFEQVRTQIAAAISAGQLAAGTKLPTVRQLATDLGLATNTVARAYRELDSVIVTHGRQGTFVRDALLDHQPSWDDGNYERLQAMERRLNLMLAGQGEIGLITAMRVREVMRDE